MASITSENFQSFQGQVCFIVPPPESLTNAPWLSNPSALTFSNTATFGQITTLRDGASDPRQIQLALKFFW